MDCENVVICTMEYYSVIKKNEMMEFVCKWMELEKITGSEITHNQKEKPHMLTVIEDS